LGDASCRYCGKVFSKNKKQQIYCSRPCAKFGRWADDRSTPYSRYYTDLINKEK
jgi:hypothetical protein